jgi:hypothetical protein
MSIRGNFYERANPAPVADAWCVYEIDGTDSGDTNQNPKILDGYGISKVERIQPGVHRVYFTNPEKVASGGYVVMCGGELGNAPNGYGFPVVHGTTASSSSAASGASGSFDLSMIGFNPVSLASPTFLADSLAAFRNRVNLAVFCLRSDRDLNKPYVANLLYNSGRFDDTTALGWGSTNVTTPGFYGVVDPSVATAPVAGASAFYIENQSGSSNFIAQGVGSVNTLHTFSVYFKSVTGVTAQLLCGGGGNNFGYQYNLSSGALTVVGTVPSGGSRSGSVEDAGNGWKRCILTFSTPNSPAPLINAPPLGTRLYMAAAQLEYGSVAYQYIGTTNTRPVYGNQDLLLRPADRGNGFGQMTYQNLLTNTENSAGWAKGNVGISAGYTAPDGTTTAFKIWEHQTPSGAPNYKNVYIGTNNANFGHTAGGHRPTTFSFYAKADERRYVRVIDSNSAVYEDLAIDLQDGKVVKNTVALDVDVYPAGDGWWKISVAAPRRASLVSNGYVTVGGVSPSVDPNDTSIPGATDSGNKYGSLHAGVSGSGILVWHGQVNHGTVYGDYVRSGAAIVGTTFSRVLGATYESVARVLPSGGAATAWGTIVVPSNTGTSSPVTAYLENSYGVASVSASSNNTFAVSFSSPMSTDSYCVITSIETETVNLPESGVGTAGSIPPTDEFVLPIMRSTSSEGVDAQRKQSGFTIRCLRQDPTTNIFSEQSVHHQRGREFKIHFMVFGGKLTYGAG